MDSRKNGASTVKRLAMNVKTNFRKYTYKTGLHVADNGEAVHKNEKEVERQNKIKEVCLNCTKEKCSGSRECFEKRKDMKND